MDEVDSFREPYNNGELVASELRSPLAVRERCGQLLTRARAGRSDWFDVDGAAQGRLADAVCEALTGPRAILSRRMRPARIPPLPSCWRLLEAGGVDRRRQLDLLLAPLPPGERAHAWLDLATVLVLMQAMPDALGRDETPGAADAPPPAKARSLARRSPRRRMPTARPASPGRGLAEDSCRACARCSVTRALRPRASTWQGRSGRLEKSPAMKPWKVATARAAGPSSRCPLAASV